MLLNYFKLKRVTPRSSSVLNQELYIFHRAGLIKDFEVRPAENKDFEGVVKMVQNIRTRDQLIADFNMYLKSRKAEVNREELIYSFQFYIMTSL